MGKCSNPACDKCDSFKCSACSTIGYCGKECQKLHWLNHKKSCKTARESYILPDNLSNILELEFEKSSTATCEAMLANPISIDLLLHTYLEKNSIFFHMGEYAASSLCHSKRFLATCGVLTCITIFVWTDKGPTSSNNQSKTVSFGAHIDAECYLGGNRRDPKNPYRFLLKKISDTFIGIKLVDIKCTLVGDHSMGSPGVNCISMGADLLTSLRDAGYTNLDTRMFKCFPGGTLSEWQNNALRTNDKLYSSHQCFFFVAFDKITGRLISHNRYYDVNHPCPMWPHRSCDLQKNGFGRQLDPNGIFLLQSSGSHKGV